MQRVMTKLTALMLLSTGSTATVQAQPWNLAGDFWNTNGGNSSRWAYGFYTSGLSPSSFSAFSTHQLRDGNRLATCYQGGNVDPNCQKNVTTSPSLQPGTGITFTPGEVTFRPFRGPTVAVSGKIVVA